MDQKRVALVTGASRGIGKAIAYELAQRGHRIALNDLDADEATTAAEDLKQEGHDVIACPADVSKYEDVERMVGTIEKTWGSVHVCVNNAGISPKHNGHKAPVTEMSPDEWDSVVDVNLNGAFYCIRTVAPIMRAQSWGRIVNISSMAARAHSDIPGAHYVASKQGLLGLTRTAAAELAPHNILVNAVCPGRIESEMMQAFPADENQSLLSKIPRGRFGSPKDIAKVVGFLSSDEVDYVVGATLDISGGRNMI